MRLGEPCVCCGHVFDVEALGPKGCPNCLGEGLEPKPILGIDPGPTQSGYALWTGFRVVTCGVMDNRTLVAAIANGEDFRGCRLAVEMIASYGMAVGREVFETCVWIGRYVQAWHEPDAVARVYRKDVKLHLCGSLRAKDPNVRQALIDRFGAPGTKRNPGRLYGVASHAWSALAVAVTAWDASATSKSWQEALACA